MEEIRKIITVDTGDSNTTLKEYRQQIDNLKESMSSLDSTTEEYREQAQELKDAQDRLNNVLKEGGDVAAHAEGSYNQLEATMAELKAQWKATGDEAERADLGKKILDINNQLKDLDASTGDFSRSIGDYAGAFEEAFNTCLDGMSSLDGPLGELGGNVKDLVPLIKATSQAATKGLGGVRKALLSTGVGALVVSVGLLVSHWDDFRKLVGISDESMSKFKDTAVNTLKNIISGVVGVGNVIVQSLLTPIRTVIGAFKGLGNVVRDVFTGDFKSIKEDAAGAIAGIASTIRDGFSFKDNYNTGVEVAESIFAGINSRLNEAEAVGEAVSDAVDTGATNKATEKADNSRPEGSGRKGGTSQPADEAKGIDNSQPEDPGRKVDNETAKILERLGQRGKSKLDLLKEQYEKERALLTQHNIDTEALDAEFAERSAEIEAEMSKELDGVLERLRQSSLSRWDIEREELETKYQYERDLLVAAGEDTTALEQYYAEERVKIKKKEKEQKIALVMQEVNIMSSAMGGMFGALAQLSEEGSEQQKAFSIMETILNTLSAIMGIWAGYSEFGPLGYAAAIAQTATVTALGAATIAKMKAVTKDSAGSTSVSGLTAGVSAPSTGGSNLTMTSVNPLLDEQADLNRLNTANIGNDKAQSLRVYVVDQDIRDANVRAQVVEDNSTF